MTNSGFQPSIKNRIGGLDELRGIAILIVVTGHYFGLRMRAPWLNDVHFGGAGVDLFLVISGFLIGKILLNSRGKENYFRTFYIRRIFRILPLYFAVLAAAASYAALRGGPGLNSLPFYLTFTQNLIPEGEQLGDIISSSYKTIEGLGPMWSLAVEEHFYLALPLAIFFLKGLRLKALLIIFAVIGVWADTYVSRTVSVSWISYSNPFETWFNMQYLAVGVLLNFEHRWRYIGIVLGAWLAAILVLDAKYMALQLALAVLIVLGTDGAVRGWFRLKSKILAKIGILVYGIYLLHSPLRILFRGESQLYGPSSILWFAVYLALVIIVAEISFRCFEMPIQRMRTRFEKPALKTEV